MECCYHGGREGKAGMMDPKRISDLSIYFMKKWEELFMKENKTENEVWAMGYYLGHHLAFRAVLIEGVGSAKKQD